MPQPHSTHSSSRSTKVLLIAAIGAAVALLAGPRLRGGTAGGTVPGRCGGDGAPARQSKALPHGKVTAALSGAKVLRGGPGELFLSVELEASRAESSGPRSPVDLVLVLDRSGSMAGEKLTSAKLAAAGIVERLGPTDRVALVVYDHTADLLVPLSPVGEGGLDQVQRALTEVEPRGGTNLHAGMVLGQQQLATGQRVNRLVLLSDGQANQGVTDPVQLGQIAAAAADRGVRTTAIGLGLDYNEDLMALLAENGRGRWHHVRDASGLEAVFAEELRAVASTVATDVTLTLAPACSGVTIAEVYGHAVRRQGDALQVPMTDLANGDGRRLIARLVVPTEGAGPTNLMSVRLSWRDPLTGERGDTSLALGAELTGDAAAVETAVDRAVMAQVLQVHSAMAVREATGRWQRGDREGARGLLGKRSSELRARAGTLGLYGLRGVKEALEALPATEADVAAHAPSSVEGRAKGKAYKANAADQLQGLKL